MRGKNVLCGWDASLGEYVDEYRGAFWQLWNAYDISMCGALDDALGEIIPYVVGRNSGQQAPAILGARQELVKESYRTTAA
jgi:hypothetical protein